MRRVLPFLLSSLSGSFFGAVGLFGACSPISPDPPYDASPPRRDAGADVRSWADAQLERILADGGLTVPDARMLPATPGP